MELYVLAVVKYDNFALFGVAAAAAVVAELAARSSSYKEKLYLEIHHQNQ